MKQQLLVTVLAMSNLLQTPGQTSNPHKVGVEKALAQHRQRIDVWTSRSCLCSMRELGSPWKSAAFGSGKGIPPSSARGREDEVVGNVMANSVAPLSPEAAKRIYESIISEMVVIESLDRKSQGAGSGRQIR